MQFPYDVSRETLDRLRELEALTIQWSRRINLVSKTDADKIWERHIIDSAQVFFLSPHDVESWADLGSGAGFPGLVCATLSGERNLRCRFTLVESDSRKSVFLKEVARQLDLDVEIVNKRIEAIQDRTFQILSARALAPLKALMVFAEQLCRPGAILLFPKGANVESELTAARQSWHIELTRHPSILNSEASILEITDFHRLP